MVDRVAGGAIIAIGIYLLFQVVCNRSNAIESVSPERFRKQLEFRRDTLRRMWWWYIGPYLGALILFAGRLAVTHPEVWFNALPFVVLSIVWAVMAGRISASEARKLQREIDELNDIEKGNGVTL